MSCRTRRGCSSSRTTISNAQGIVDLLLHDDIEVAAVATGAEALDVLHERAVECCVIDLKLPDMTGFELLDRMQAEPRLRDTPVVVFTGKELSTDEDAQLRDGRQERGPEGRAVAGAVVR